MDTDEYDEKVKNGANISISFQMRLFQAHFKENIFYLVYMGIACDKPWFFKYDFLEKSHLKLKCFIFYFDFLKVNF